MKRGTRESGKLTQNYNEYLQPQQIESYFTTEEQQIKEKDLQEKSRSKFRNKFKENDEQQQTDDTVGCTRNVDVNIPQKKFNKLFSKTVQQLEKVKSITEVKKNETENVVDLRRQLQRADEFSIRFSRNNLYEAKRIINEVKNLLIPYPFENTSHCKILWKKIILAFQASSQALQTYINYAKNPANLEIPEKVHELVLIIADLFLFYEQLSLPSNNVHVRNDAVKTCNELINILKTKVPVSYYVEFKELDLEKNKNKKKVSEELFKMKKFAMYKKKLTPKIKSELPKKKLMGHCPLGLKPKKSKSDDMKARITHGIYTQKLNPRALEGLGSKTVKFKQESQEKPENPEEKKPVKKHRTTPREVKSQDDDVETMVQTIGDDDLSTGRFSSPSSKTDGENSINKNYFKHLLLETITELRNADKNGEKETLTKFLNSIQNCTKTENQNLESDKVKVYHMYSKDLIEEMENAKKSGKEEEKDKQTIKTSGAGDEPKNIEETSPERRLNIVFKIKNSHVRTGETASKGKIQLKLSEETMNNATKYKKAFTDYRKNNIMYKKTLANKPWELVGKVSDRIILDIIKEITTELENDVLLRRLYFSELLEVMS